MAEPEFAEAVQRFRNQLLARERRAAVRLARAYGRIYQTLQPEIEALSEAIEAMDRPSRRDVERLARLRSLRRQIADEITRFGNFAEGVIDEEARESMQAAMRDAEETVRATLPGIEALDREILARWNRLPTEAVEALLSFLEPSSPLKTMLRETLGPTVADRVSDKLLDGVALGFNPRKTAEIIRRQLGVGLNWALTTARTTQLYTYREAQRANYIANGEVLAGWIWRSSRDGRTCPSCLAQDNGQVRPFTERLNDHHNGRCWMEPVTRTYSELAGLDIEEPVRDRGTGEDFFRSLPAAQQRDILGPSKYDAWQAGKIDFAQLSAVQSDPVWGDMRRVPTLTELGL